VRGQKFKAHTCGASIEYKKQPAPRTASVSVPDQKESIRGTEVRTRERNARFNETRVSHAREQRRCRGHVPRGHKGGVPILSDRHALQKRNAQKVPNGGKRCVNPIR